MCQICWPKRWILIVNENLRSLECLKWTITLMQWHLITCLILDHLRWLNSVGHFPMSITSICWNSETIWVPAKLWRSESDLIYSVSNILLRGPVSHLIRLIFLRRKTDKTNKCTFLSILHLLSQIDKFQRDGKQTKNSTNHVYAPFAQQAGLFIK